MTRDFRTEGINLGILPWTGRIDGDDSGYRTRQIQENNDPLVVLPERFMRIPVYAVGAVTGICPYYRNGLGAATTMLVREPVVDRLDRMNDLLKPYKRKIIVLDAFRSASTQARLWRYLFERRALAEKKHAMDVSIAELLRFGLEADVYGAYNEVDESTDMFVRAHRRATDRVVHELHRNGSGRRLQSVIAQLVGKDISTLDLARFVVIFEANLGLNDVPLSRSSSTAHGSGGATDLYLCDTEVGFSTNLGVPFDYVGEPSRIDFFENDMNIKIYREKVSQDQFLARYLAYAGCSAEAITMKTWYQIRDERRILYHAAVAAGATMYVAEPWHYNWPAGYGEMPLSGNACQAVLTGSRAAVWGNEFAHQEAQRLGL